MEKHTVSASLTDNTKYMNRALPVKKSFDIIERNLIIGGQNSAFYFIDGFHAETYGLLPQYFRR